jgi:hypothetical protein
MPSKLELARKSAKRARDKAREGKQKLLQKGTMLGAAYGVGRLEETGRMDDIPQILGMPRTLTVAGLGYGLAMFTGGTLADVAEGAADGAASVAAYQYGKGEDVSGDEDDELAELTAEVEAAEREAGISGDDDDDDIIVEVDDD